MRSRRTQGPEPVEGDALALPAIRSLREFIYGSLFGMKPCDRVPTAYGAATPQMKITRRQALGMFGAMSLPANGLLAQAGKVDAPAALAASPSASPPLSELPPDLVNLHPLMEQIAKDHAPRLSFLDSRWTELNGWKTEARPAFLSKLSYHPRPTPLGAELVRKEERDGFTMEVVNIHATPAYSIPARVLIPKGRAEKERLPAVVAMHCHSGRYTWGHQKILSDPQDSQALVDFRNNTYGRPWAEALVRRGYVVIVIDAFYFGERRLRVEDLAPSRVFGEVKDRLGELKTHAPDSVEGIMARNRICAFYEHHTAKTLFAAGATWPGLHAWDDMRTVDYLASRSEVDPDRIGAIGLSGGGFRTALLIAADPRIKAASITGWMTEFAQQLRHHVRHTWMVWLPGLYRDFDLPDAVALHAPGALLVQQCRRDTLYPLTAMQASVEKLTRIYEKAGCGEKFRGTFYDVPHSFRPEMQEEAFEWMKTWL